MKSKEYDKAPICLYYPVPHVPAFVKNGIEEGRYHAEDQWLKFFLVYKIAPPTLFMIVVNLVIWVFFHTIPIVMIFFFPVMMFSYIIYAAKFKSIIDLLLGSFNQKMYSYLCLYVSSSDLDVLNGVKSPEIRKQIVTILRGVNDSRASRASHRLDKEVEQKMIDFEFLSLGETLSLAKQDGRNDPIVRKIVEDREPFNTASSSEKKALTDWENYKVS